jgi:hypothetical protein
MISAFCDPELLRPGNQDHPLPQKGYVERLNDRLIPVIVSPVEFE